MGDLYRWGDWDLSPRERVLRCKGEPVALGARAFDLLVALAEGRGDVLGKDQLLTRVWPGVVVEENNLTVQVSALRKLLGAGAIATVAGRGYQFTVPVQAQTASAAGEPAPGVLALPDRPSIVVLPFTALPADPSQAWFCDGLTDDLITELSRFHSLFVIARATAFTYRGAAVDVRAVGRELGVRYVLQGSVRRSGERVRVSAHLADAATGSQLWSERYDPTPADLLDLQEQLTGDIVAAIAPQIEVTETLRARSHRPADRSNHELAMQAWATANDGDRDPGARERALEMAQAAVAVDPTSALGWRTIAFTQAMQVYYDTARQPAEAAAAGLAAATRAVELDPADHHGHVYKGLVLGITGRADEALASLRRAVELNGNDATALALLGFLEALCDDAPQGIRRTREALRRSPRDPRRYLLLNMLAWALFAGGEDAQAVAVSRQLIAERPTYPQIHLCLALALAGLGDVPSARQAFEHARALAPAFVQSRLNGVWIGNGRIYRDRTRRFIRVAAGLPPDGAQ